jgi:hypothetical protein
MNLQEYLALDKSPSLTELSEKMGISKGRLSQLRTSLNWPPELAMTAEIESGGALDAAHLSPIIAQARYGADI